MDDIEDPMFQEKTEVREANQIDMTKYRFERFSDTKNSYIFVKRRTQLPKSFDKQPNFIETNILDEANQVDMSVYRFEVYSEVRGTYIFVKRRVV